MDLKTYVTQKINETGLEQWSMNHEGPLHYGYKN